MAYVMGGLRQLAKEIGLFDGRRDHKSIKRRLIKAYVELAKWLGAQAYHRVMRGVQGWKDDGHSPTYDDRWTTSYGDKNENDLCKMDWRTPQAFEFRGRPRRAQRWETDGEKDLRTLEDDTRTLKVLADDVFRFGEAAAMVMAFLRFRRDAGVTNAPDSTGRGPWQASERKLAEQVGITRKQLRTVRAKLTAARLLRVSNPLAHGKTAQHQRHGTCWFLLYEQPFTGGGGQKGPAE